MWSYVQYRTWYSTSTYIYTVHYSNVKYIPTVKCTKKGSCEEAKKEDRLFDYLDCFCRFRSPVRLSIRSEAVEKSKLSEEQKVCPHTRMYIVRVDCYSGQVAVVRVQYLGCQLTNLVLPSYAYVFK
jgi:hypothetical protein